jgi:phosphoadenosine phosphosulfate reductase
MSTAVVASLLEKTKDFSIEDTLSFLANEYPNQVVFSTSFGQEDQVITDFISKNELPITIFTLDTGRLFQETYDVFHKTVKKYKTEIKTYFPETAAIESLLNEKGPNSFYSSVENRKECCFIRKVAPLTKALQGNAIWTFLNTMPILISLNSIHY